VTARTIGVGLGIAVLGAAALLAWTFTAAPLPAPAPYAGAWPAASPPEGMALLALPTGVTHRSAAFAYRGGSFLDARDFAMTAVLVKHPRGDLLIDTGFGSDVGAALATLPAPFRAITSYTRGEPAARQLEAMDAGRPSAILLTHAHWDHVSGLSDFPRTPVLVTAAEHAFIRGGGVLTAAARLVPDARYREYGFDGGAYLGFPESLDVHGDGSVVIVPAPGHTPGSVAIFVTLPNGQHVVFVGDLVWQREGLTEREERPWLAKVLGDGDPAQVREGILRVSALAQRWPELVLVPAHDARGLDALQQR